MRYGALDAALPEDHPARIVWEYVESIDFGPLYELVKAVEGRAGRRPIDPKILMALWLYATLSAVGSARQIERLCETDAAYQWICGGVGVNYHTISDFRTELGFLDRVLTQSVAGLCCERLVSLTRVAQDGVRGRASAGAASFRREATLEECYAQAQEQVRQLRAELESDPGRRASGSGRRGSVRCGSGRSGSGGR